MNKQYNLGNINPRKPQSNVKCIPPFKVRALEVKGNIIRDGRGHAGFSSDLRRIDCFLLKNDHESFCSYNQVKI